MKGIAYSFIIPVYNRPDEIDELLLSLSLQDFEKPFEVVVVEDGSTKDCKSVIKNYSEQLSVLYLFKPNSGPGDSRNYGMQRANGNYFIILDSDCILPPQYLSEVDTFLSKTYVDCFGGPDAAHDSFSDIQKAINYAMTSFLTTGGIRGRKNAVNKFQPRSFNMGLSKKAFEATRGFGNIHPGEDPDLTIRLWKAGFETSLIDTAYVYHKRRIDWQKFYIQVNKFGMVRPILNHWHPETAKLTYWFPAVFSIGLLVSIVLLVVKIRLPLYCFLAYFLILLVDSFLKNKNLKIAIYSLRAVLVQFFGYGYGFLKSNFYIKVLRRQPEIQFPKLFFKIN